MADYRVDSNTAIGIPTALAVGVQKWVEWNKEQEKRKKDDPNFKPATPEEEIREKKRMAHEAIDENRYLRAAGTQKLVEEYTDRLFLLAQNSGQDNGENNALKYMHEAERAIGGRNIKADIDAAMHGNPMKLSELHGIQQQLSAAGDKYLGMKEWKNYITHFEDAVNGKVPGFPGTAQSKQSNENPLAQNVEIKPDQRAAEEIKQQDSMHPFLKLLLLIVELFTGISFGQPNDQGTRVRDERIAETPVLQHKLSPAQHTITDMIIPAGRLANNDYANQAQRLGDVEMIRNAAIKLGGVPGQGATRTLSSEESKELGGLVLDKAKDALNGNEDDQKAFGKGVLDHIDKSKVTDKGSEIKTNPALNLNALGMIAHNVESAISQTMRSFDAVTSLFTILPVSTPQKPASTKKNL